MLTFTHYKLRITTNYDIGGGIMIQNKEIELAMKKAHLKAIFKILLSKGSLDNATYNKIIAKIDAMTA